MNIYFNFKIMQQNLIISSILLSFLYSCKNGEKQTMNPDVIDIESTIQNLSRLKVSDFGKTIRYVPLETTDDGLVGNNPVVKVSKKYIIIEAQRKCLLFDKKDGQFIASIGHFGQDPEAYSSIFSWMDDKEEFMYFQRYPNQLVKYDVKGNYCGKVEFSSPPGLASNYLITDSTIIGYFASNMHYVIGIFCKEGLLKDTISSFFHRAKPPKTEDIMSVDVLRGYNMYGNWGSAGATIINFKDDTKQIISPISTTWYNNENIRYKEAFVDTLYTLIGNSFVPSIVFNTGKYSWPVQDVRNNEHNTNERIFISDVSENNNFVFFQCIKRLYSNEPVLYNGLYDKKTGQTKLSNNSDTIEDDLTYFMPFIPLGISTSGEFVSLVEAWKVMEWLEKNPEAVKHANLSFLKELNAEMNPIVILVE